MSKEFCEFDPEKIIEIDKNPLWRESDRGCVLILASDIENLLNDILKSWFNNLSQLTKKEEEIIFDFTGPLGTFSSKIYLAKAVGLLDSNVHSDIHKIRTIRNIAAHSGSSFSLSNPDVIKIVTSMHFDYARTCQLRRFSLKSNNNVQNDDIKGDEINESIMKGFGLIRFHKTNFILTVLKIELELSILRLASKSVGPIVLAIRNKEVDRFRKVLDSKKEQKSSESEG